MIFMFEVNLIEVFILGLLFGFGPCTVFCAPILTPMVLSSAKSAKEGLFEGISFSLGRLLSYSVLGAAAAFIGSKISTIMPPWFFGLFIIVLGILILLKKTPKLCGVFSKYKGVHAAFVTGVFVGFAPCYPLVAALSLAAVSGSVFLGALIGFVFGLGTMLSPLLLISLAAGKWASFSIQFQKTNTIISGLFLIFLGAITLLAV